MALAQASAVAATMGIDNKKAVQEINISQLQRTLRINPLMDGSQAEILLDNDVTPKISLPKEVGRKSLPEVNMQPHN